ncbi:hypothetical protein D7Y53_01195 [Stenotrophomonas maltophilia]|uniref:hypothetical protein n=1 Tax=Stenotrophomonas maltophilia TaxID=40324 RepID=UPI0015DE1D12|nr:hypothetical protein [Stenotrophomonas maltophilia]MBA0428562.1 hypothetical protein [Stenotrophomonas maltophilia]
MTDSTQSTALSPAREAASIERGLAMDATSFEGVHTVFSHGNAFNLAVKMASMLSDSTVIPSPYQGNPSNCLIAIDYAARLRVSPVMLMQNMDVVKGRPGLRGAFLIGLINACPLFSRIKFEWRGCPDDGTGQPTGDYGCRAYATEIETGDVLQGTWVDWAMVIGEGWDRDNGSQKSKWNTLRDQMFQYRAASFWSRTNASDVTLGLHTVEELDYLENAPGYARESPSPVIEHDHDRGMPGLLGELADRARSAAAHIDLAEPRSPAEDESSAPPTDTAPTNDAQPKARNKRRIIE